MATPIAAIKSRVQLNGTNLYIQKMQVQAGAEMIDVTTFEDWDASRVDMFRKRLKGIRELKFTIDGYYDIDNPPITTGIDGSTMTNLKYWPNVRDYPNRYWSVPSSTADQVTVGSQMPGANYVSISITGMSQGGFDYPSAAA